MLHHFSNAKWFINQFYPNALTEKSTDEKILYLTFDDGPVPGVSEFVLQELKKVSAKATFFCVGNNISKFPQILQNIINDDHQVGNHTYNHLNGWISKTTDYFNDFLAFEKLFTTHLFRPPYGKIRPSQYKQISKTHQVVFWSVLTHDYNNKLDKEKCLTKCFNVTKNGNIIVFHDSYKAEKNLVYVLPRFLKYFSSMGYKFNTL